MGQSSVGATLIAAAVVVLAVGMAWMNISDGGDDLAAPLAERALASAGAAQAAEGEIPPSQPAVPFSFGPNGEIIRTEPQTARVIDPDTGLEVLITLPPGSTVVDSRVVPLDSVPGTSGGTGTTNPGTGGGPTTTRGSPSTTLPQQTTTTTLPEETTTTLPAETTTTTLPEETTTTLPAEPTGLVGGLLDVVGGLLSP
jgi:hypothetical protein